MISISKSKFVILGFVVVAVLLIPANDAFADVPSPITDITIGHPSGTVIEWDMDYNSLCADYGMCYSGFHQMDVYVNKDNHNGFTEKHFSFNESGGTSGEIQLIKEGTYDYKLKLDTTGYSDGNMRIHIDFQYQPNSNLSGGGDFTIASFYVDLISPVITIPELTTDQWGNKNLELSMSGTTNFPTGSWTLDVTDNVGVTDSACWANIMDDPSNPWISSSQSYDFSKITNNPSGQKFPIGPTSISCAAYDAAGNRSESNFRVVVTHDDPTGFVQYVDKPNSFGNTPDSTTKIFYSANSGQALHLLKPIADLLTDSNSQGMITRDETRTLLNGAITINDDPNSFYARMSGDGYDREIAKPLANMLTDSNMVGMLERNNPDRTWSVGDNTITISENSGNFAATVDISQGNSGQGFSLLKPFADMLTESNMNQAIFERTSLRLIDASGDPPASTPTTTLTIDTLNIYEEGSNLMYVINGETPISGAIEVQIITPTNATNQVHNFGTNVPTYQAGGAILNPSIGSGWQVQICVAEFSVCAVENFTINSYPNSESTSLIGPTTASGTFTVTDGVNGGDCTSIGTWDSSSKTCNVTADITGGIIVGSDGITLNGNSNEFTGWISDSDCIPSCSHNISVHSKNNITIKNFESINSAGNYALAIHSSQYVNVTNNNNLGAAIMDSQHVTMTDNTIKPALKIASSYASANSCPSDLEINNNHFEQMGQNTPGMLLDGAAYQDNISCVWYNLNAAGNTGSGNVLNFNLNPTSPDPSQSTNASVTGRIWEDDNWNGVYDDGEGVGDVRCVTLNPSLPSGLYSSCAHVTGGMYEFTNLIPGTSYSVTYEYPWLHLNPTFLEPTSVSFVLSEDETRVINFGTNPCDYVNGELVCPSTTPVDVIAPILQVPTTQTVTTSDENGSQVVIFSVTATDDRGVIDGPTCSRTSGDSFSIGTHEITCTATDAAGNLGTASFMVIVSYSDIDTVSPIISIPEDITLQITNSTGVSITFNVTATDNFGIASGPDCNPSSNQLFSVGVTSVTCIATDTSGNVGTDSFLVTIINIAAVGDTIPPTFSTHSDITVDATTSNGATISYDLPQVTDDTAVTSGPTCIPTSGSFFPIGPTIVTCTAKDAAGNQGSTTFTITVKSLIAAPVEIPTAISVSVGKPHYSSTEAIFVTGIATPQTDNDVSISVKDSENNLVSVESLSVESSGVYTGIIFPNSLWSTNGTYLMSANYGTSTNGTSFDFQFIPTEIDNSNIPTGITLSLDSTQRILGDNLEITSTLTGGTSGQSILVEVTNQIGDSVLLQSLNTDDIGSVTLSLDIQNNWIPGEYTITARDMSPLWDYSASESLQIVAPLPEITVSPTITTTQFGDEITSYNAGDIGYFSTSLLSEATFGVLVTVNVVDSQDTTLGVAFFKSVIGKGDSNIVLGFKIPEDAADGEAQIYINTYTDWIDQGGITISSELISTVNINGIITETVSEFTSNDSFGVVIIPANGSGAPGCEVTPEGCFLPLTDTVSIGEVVLFSNTDAASHTFTAGSPADGPTGEFDTSMVMAGDSYEWTANVAGEIDYFCMVHPWMIGLLIVQGDTIESSVIPENIIPTLSFASNVMLSASTTSGSIVNYGVPTTTGGIISTDVQCTPPSGNLFPIGSTQVTCTATNEIGNTGMTSFMVTITPIPQVNNQTVSILVGKDTYSSIEPLFVTGSVGTITGDPINLEVRDTVNNLVGIEQINPKESGSYSAVLTSSDLWSTNGTYSMIANYGDITAVDTFEFEIIPDMSQSQNESNPTGLVISTESSSYLLGESILINLKLEGASSGEPIQLEIRDSQNNQILLQSLNTDSLGNTDITYQLQQTQDSGIYSIIATADSNTWSYSDTAIFTAIAPIPDITVGDIISTIQNGTAVDSFGVGEMGYFQTPIISNSTSDVLITVNVFDVEDTPLGLAYFKSKIVNDEFDIVLGLQIPYDAAPGMATIYINTYTDWTENGGVVILDEIVSQIEISPSNVTDLTISTNSTGGES